ncbi:Nuclear transcription factor Y subunit A-7 like [Melia azedarach]|uniref:Nuclear transcription factor Y subunit A-7 like n=1 Tax=Melia azedarach TaxID=155640 RepID=A0ACC1WV71_MELAZ|nr:Nuclear transcription factor Y subunit A-7 like [Melia azedarach]
MTSSVHDMSDNSEAEEQQKHSELRIQSSSPVTGMTHPSITTPNVQYAASQVGAGHAMIVLVSVSDTKKMLKWQGVDDCMSSFALVMMCRVVLE